MRGMSGTWPSPTNILSHGKVPFQKMPPPPPPPNKIRPMRFLVSHSSGNIGFYCRNKICFPESKNNNYISYQIQKHLMKHSHRLPTLVRQYMTYRNIGKTNNMTNILRNNVSRFVPGIKGYLYKFLGKHLIEFLF
jgi:hypothetical protein